MSRLILPLVESLIDACGDVSLSRVRIIGVQHILETTHAMFQSLYKLGLKPENVSIIGKCYSTCQEVYDEMIQDGIDVCPGSFVYSSHTSFDELYTQTIKQFLEFRVPNISKDQYDCIIVLDDGGKCISFFSDYNSNSIPVVAIEQTSSGYHAIRQKELNFPVINVARSPAKLTLEAPMIAQAAAERLYKSLQKRNLSFDNALIIGGGAIGQAIRNHLSNDMDIKIWDRNINYSDYGHLDLPDILGDFSLIIGCTGETSVPHHLHSLLSPETVLVSASSSDREFDAHHLRRKTSDGKSCYSDLEIDDLLLVNSGFPVNFDGERENIDLHLIQLTIALISAGILQAYRIAHTAEAGILPLDPSLEAGIQSEFLESQKPNN